MDTCIPHACARPQTPAERNPTKTDRDLIDMDNQAPQTHSFTFTGQGGEYFRIWIVNVALTIVTLGIYSAWAKVRRLQYFYRNTSLAGSGFDYHGDPLAILKGRLIGVGLFVAYNVAARTDPLIGLGALILLLAVLPWLLQRSLCFKLANSSYRGLRFRFAGTTGGAYGVFLAWPILGYMTLGLLFPFVHQRIKAWQHGNSRYGTTPFSFTAGVGGFYAIYGKLILMLAVAIGLAIAAASGLGLFALLDNPYLSREQRAGLIGMLALGFLAAYLLAMLFVGPWFAARMQNLVWNGTALGPHGLRSDVRARDLLAIYLTNFLAILLTVGLFKPFADIRLARYRLEHMALAAQTDLDEFVAGQASAVAATGEETAEVFDVDISF
ncbi:DUF898 domain-containing protein [Parasulfuritortus cantonensis]|uniref:DUF898 domain-containing protein n=1 Tax=Parasulfuritortus cantonensis TaxID=2528202 RepID=A0A4R1BL01_9PROT|nr:YjgN family protein [Parasulfuritortus cantonensis]TCJ18019.1 DUF898 domain-containing protein [Parasulfuritortus cantonensis]